MNEEFSTALMLLAVGMITVFTILALIALFGNLLILLVNKFIPETKVSSIVSKATSVLLDPGKITAIVSAVDITTEGKARVTSITKV